ncbi:metal ABC transporter solute-binding protein, Zn/Mn family [Marinospirillum alkaliphilum]|uniref:High-affinity zinc uptake system protein ZnuA n=1 Tax=Marinospirillum alkaliphilum DSM 21637 TaxID=1122209 RepID=A0A1K1UXS5_9GAMM|nr:zinc ABC transporter substrate-binding protein [Marinospirillum alkaliphilum]SFX17323.1 zinc transport system substrate-binding protein [Marinospirillum alkaliphilum DSM 21637]
MNTTRLLMLLSILLLPGSLLARPLVVGITLHPYYSYVSEIAGDKARVLPLIESGFNPHNYELQPADLRRLTEMDALVLNAIGHDEFAVHALENLELPNLTLIHANRDVPLLSYGRGNSNYNPHSFVAIDAAIRQVYTIAAELGRLDPDHAEYFQQNALRYARELRQLKNRYRSQLLALDLSNIRIASTHNAYGYLLQEFGIGVDTVIEPAHGVEPSASQLQDTIRRIREANIQVLFTELDMDNRYVDVIEKATGIQIHHFSHMTHGEYDRTLVMREMEHNLQTLVKALTAAVEPR